MESWLRETMSQFFMEWDRYEGDDVDWFINNCTRHIITRLPEFLGTDEYGNIVEKYT